MKPKIILCDQNPEVVKAIQAANLKSDFIYEVGKTVKSTEPFDEDRWAECSSGIHFFITKSEAENWNC